MCITLTVNGRYASVPIRKAGCPHLLVGAKAFAYGEGELLSYFFRTPFTLKEGNVPGFHRQIGVQIGAPTTRQLSVIRFTDLCDKWVATFAAFKGNIHVMPIQFEDGTYACLDSVERVISPYGSKEYRLLYKARKCVCLPVAFGLRDVQMGADHGVVVEEVWLLPPDLLFTCIELVLTITPQEKKQYKREFEKIRAMAK